MSNVKQTASRRMGVARIGLVWGWGERGGGTQECLKCKKRDANYYAKDAARKGPFEGGVSSTPFDLRCRP